MNEHNKNPDTHFNIRFLKYVFENDIDGVKIEGLIKETVDDTFELPIKIIDANDVDTYNRRIRNELRNKYPDMLRRFETAITLFIGHEHTLNGILHIALHAILNGNTPRGIYLNENAYFKYLEYIELKEAREESIQARKEAKTALKIAILALIASIIFSIWQIYSPVNLSQETLETLNYIENQQDDEV
ncbi:hypothetical protein JW758_00755 [Candidatus Peregrinibacteria bacterium]|nr:hypothetical protein [Candidatus Peregrinibacteria bacterium]